MGCVKGKHRGKIKGKPDFICKKCGQCSDSPFELCKAKPIDANFFDKKAKGKK